MIRKFSIDRNRVEAYAAKREAAFGLARSTRDAENAILSEIGIIEARHAQSRRLYFGGVTIPPSEIARIAELRASLPKAKARTAAAEAALSAVGGLTTRIAEYATPAPARFGGSMIKGLSHG